MGPVLAVVAVVGGLIAIGSTITQTIADNIQKQVDDIINSHSDDATKLKNLQSLLQKLDFSKIYAAVNKMSAILNGNFDLFLSDQKAKIQLLKQITINSDTQKSTFWDKFVNSLSNVGNIVSTVSLILSTNPAGAVVGFVINVVWSICSIISNITRINDLKEEKQQLITYFQPGGIFEQQQQSIRDNSILMIENLYLMIVNEKNSLKMLDARISLFDIETPSSIDYNAYHQIICQDPFSYNFEDLVFNAYGQIQNILADQSLSVSSQISRIYSILEQILDGDEITQKIQKVADIFDQFSEDSTIGKKLQDQATMIDNLNNFRTHYIAYFQERQKQTEQQKKINDPIMIGVMLQFANFSFPGTQENNKKKYIAETVSFFTTTYYGDDPTGVTIYGYNLVQLQKKTRLLQYISPLQGPMNFVLPPPEGDGYNSWVQKRDILVNQFKKTFQPQHPAQLIFENMYMRLQVANITLGDKTVQKLSIIYGVVLFCHITYYTQEMSFQLLYAALKTQYPASYISQNPLNNPNNNPDPIPNPYENPSYGDDSSDGSNQNPLSIPLVNGGGNGDNDSEDQDYDYSCRLIKCVNSTPVFQGIGFVENGSIPSMLNAINLLKNGTQAEKNAIINDQKWSNYQINGQNFINFGSNFQGLCINFRDMRVLPESIMTISATQNLSQENIVISNPSTLKYRVLLTIAACMKAKQLSSILIQPQNQEVSNVRLFWSSKKQQANNIDGKFLNCIQSNVQDLKNIASELRSKRKQLFIMNVINQQKAYYWYLE